MDPRFPIEVFFIINGHGSLLTSPVSKKYLKYLEEGQHRTHNNLLAGVSSAGERSDLLPPNEPIKIFEKNVNMIHLAPIACRAWLLPSKDEDLLNNIQRRYYYDFKTLGGFYKAIEEEYSFVNCDNPTQSGTSYREICRTLHIEKGEHPEIAMRVEKDEIYEKSYDFNPRHRNPSTQAIWERSFGIYDLRYPITPENRILQEILTSDISADLSALLYAISRHYLLPLYGSEDPDDYVINIFDMTCSTTWNVRSSQEESRRTTRGIMRKGRRQKEEQTFSSISHTYIPPPFGHPNYVEVRRMQPIIMDEGDDDNNSVDSHEIDISHEAAVSHSDNGNPHSTAMDYETSHFEREPSNIDSDDETVYDEEEKVGNHGGKRDKRKRTTKKNYKKRKTRKIRLSSKKNKKSISKKNKKSISKKNKKSISKKNKKSISKKSK